MEKKYLTRIADQMLSDHLESSGGVLIEGPKWCGKTWTARRASKSQLFMQDPDRAATYKQIADTKPSLLLEGETPRLLDEWQVAPVLWDAVRFTVDVRGGTGHFILTGSALPPEEETPDHSGAGRISRFKMRPMSLYESQESTGSVSLRALFDGVEDVYGQSSMSLEEITFALVRGGWPEAVTGPERSALKRSINYVETIIQTDISRVDNIKKDPIKVRDLMLSLARNTATMATIKTIQDDIARGDIDNTLSSPTIYGYLNALERIFVVEDLPAWSPSLRSKTAIRTTPKRHFIDPSIATAVMRLTPSRLLKDFAFFGFLFESLCVRDLRVYADGNDGQVFHYRDANGLEADAVVVLHDGRWGAVEVKLGAKQIDEAATHLLALKERVNTDKMLEPSFLMILTAGEFAYRREDGVFVVPLACLRD